MRMRTKMGAFVFVLFIRISLQATCVKNYSLFHRFRHGSEMIIFESILNTFITRVVFRGGWGSSENWLELKIEPP